MDQTRRIFCVALIALGASFSSQATSAIACDHTYVREGRNAITLLPTGLDDTANIQCALDQAVARHRWTAIQFVAGTYKTAQIVATNFVGSLSGAGSNRTVVQNLPNLEVTATDFVTQAPSLLVKWPTLFAFNGGNIGVYDLAIRVVGAAPTTGWSFFGEQFKELVAGILILGARAHVSVDHVRVEGEQSNGPFSYNVINGIFPEGAFGGNPSLQSGSFTVTRSTFRRVNSPAPFALTDHFLAIYSHNTYEDTFFGLEALDFRNTKLLFSNNRVDATIGVDVYDYGELPFGVESSDLLFFHNTFVGDNGIALEATFGPDVHCALLGNDVSAVSGVGIYLGPGTYGCHVAGSGKNANIVDLGEHNQILGTQPASIDGRAQAQGILGALRRNRIR